MKRSRRSGSPPHTNPGDPDRRKQKPDLIRRKEALERTLARYRGKRFRPGSGDCVQLARTHLLAMGHVRVPKARAYRTVAAGIAELKRFGCANLGDMVGKLLPEIAPAAVLPGDVALVAAEPDAPLAELGSLVLALGGVKYAGWHPDSPVLAVIEIEADKIDKAWRA